MREDIEILNNLENPNSSSLETIRVMIQSQIVAEYKALDGEHDWKSDVPVEERAEIQEAVDGAQKHCDKVLQAEAVGRIIFAIFSVL